MILDEIAAYIATNGHGTVGTTIFKGRMPEAPADAIALHEYGGGSPDFTHDSDTPIMESPRVQVMVRHSSYSTGRTLIEAIYRDLCRVHNQSLSGTYYYRLIPQQSPFYLRRDENERVEFTVNFQANKQVSA